MYKYSKRRHLLRLPPYWGWCPSSPNGQIHSRRSWWWRLLCCYCISHMIWSCLLHQLESTGILIDYACHSLAGRCRWNTPVESICRKIHCFVIYEVSWEVGGEMATKYTEIKLNSTTSFEGDERRTTSLLIFTTSLYAHDYSLYSQKRQASNNYADSTLLS